ncbi:MAG: hypothetical protein E7266_03705 [Lachnospiraceae bacterium]|nr:hypothetical protein [Lachnospiraceae bacterium]
MEQSIDLQPKKKHKKDMFKIAGIFLISYGAVQFIMLYYDEIFQYILSKDINTLSNIYSKSLDSIALFIVLPTIFCLMSIIAAIFILKKKYVAIAITFGVMCIYPFVYISMFASGLFSDFFGNSEVKRSPGMVISSIFLILTNVTLLIALVFAIICIVRVNKNKSVKKVWAMPGAISVINLVLTILHIFSNAFFLVFFIIMITEVSQSDNIVEMVRGIVVVISYILSFAVKILPSVLLTIFFFLFGRALRKDVCG